MKRTYYGIILLVLSIVSCGQDFCDQEVNKTINTSFKTESELILNIPSTNQNEILLKYNHIIGDSGTDVSIFDIKSEDRSISFLSDNYFDTIFIATQTANSPMTTFNSLSNFTPDTNAIVSIESFFIRQYPKINDLKFHSSPIEEFDSDSLVISKIDNSNIPSPIGSYSIVNDFWKNIDNKYIHFIVKETSEKGYILLSADENSNLTIHTMGICD